MRPFNLYTSLFAPEGEGVGSGDPKPKEEPKTGKIKVGTKEYDEASLTSATTLYEALQDPDTGIEIIETLARRAGLLGKDGDIKPKEGETKKEAKSRAAEKIKNKLGKDYEKFADSLGPVLDELLDEYLTEHTAKFNNTNTQSDWSRAVDKFTSEWDTSGEIEEVMQEMIQDSPPNFNRKGFNAEKYLERMYRAACNELDIEPKEKEEKPKGKSSRRRSAPRDDEFPDIVEREAPKEVSVDDAVEAAIKGIRFKKR